MRTYSAIAGGVALSILMLPTIILTAEQALRMVPQRMKDAAFGMGCTQTQTIWKVVLPTGLPGILTGVMLAIAGASAPLLFYCAVQQLLDQQSERADRLAIDPHLQLLRDAVREPDRARLGGVPGPRADCPRLQHPQPDRRPAKGLTKWVDRDERDCGSRLSNQGSYIGGTG
jgi:hypothetical protein